jgi:hypothetical protein
MKDLFFSNWKGNWLKIQYQVEDSQKNGDGKKLGNINEYSRKSFLFFFTNDQNINKNENKLWKWFSQRNSLWSGRAIFKFIMKLSRMYSCILENPRDSNKTISYLLAALYIRLLLYRLIVWFNFWHLTECVFRSASIRGHTFVLDGFIILNLFNFFVSWWYFLVGCF